MSFRSRVAVSSIATCLVFSLLVCAASKPPVPAAAAGNPGTTSMVRFPEAAAPILTKTLGDRIGVGMAQDAVISILIDAAKGEPSAEGMIEPIVTQAKLNPIRLDLTLIQGKRTLIFAFKSNKLVDKKREGFA